MIDIHIRIDKKLLVRIFIAIILINLGLCLLFNLLWLTSFDYEWTEKILSFQEFLFWLPWAHHNYCSWCIDHHSGNLIWFHKVLLNW